ncbi:unnamed protein product [Cuscuta epithymum]|uniref:Photosystem II D1 processing protein PSB27-H2, chloroplastic n=1 Tax=Cuscuta epithymum TaxID=186058 RepID=A0AAV0D1P0_9ASTE|nr:unnamed protein product [Cuscuta epithymum]
MAFFLPVQMKMCPVNVFSSVDRCKVVTDYKLKSSHHDVLAGEEQSRRRFLLGCSMIPFVSFNGRFGLLPAWAGEKSKAAQDDEGVIGALKSLFEPNEKTKSGKFLPKDYLKSVREVIKTLRESLEEDPNDMAKFRRTADAAKESIRAYLGGWRGDKTVVNEESYEMLERAIRALANFYSEAGPSAPLPEHVKVEILNDLIKAEDDL